MEDSLRRLQTNRIDPKQSHANDAETLRAQLASAVQRMLNPAALPVMAADSA